MSYCCPKCGKPLSVSDVKGYPFVCLNCDENFYLFEVAWKDAEETTICESDEPKRMPLKFVVEHPCEGCYYEFDTLEEARKLYDEIEPSEGEFAYLFKDVITEHGDLDNIGFAYKDWEGEKE